MWLEWWKVTLGTLPLPNGPESSFGRCGENWSSGGMEERIGSFGGRGGENLSSCRREGGRSWIFGGMGGKIGSSGENEL